MPSVLDPLGLLDAEDNIEPQKLIEIVGLINKKKATPRDMQKFLSSLNGKAQWGTFAKKLWPKFKSQQPSLSTFVYVEASHKTITVLSKPGKLSDSGIEHRVYEYDDSTVQGDDLQERVDQVIDTVTAPIQFLQKLAAAIFSVQFWIRVLEAAIALLLIAIGLSKLASDTPVGKAATRAISVGSKKR